MARPAGYIKLYRSIMDWEWYKVQNTKDLYFHLMLLASHEPTNYKGIPIERGQCVVTLPMLENDLNLSTQQARTALNNLKSTGNITDKIYNKFRVITVLGYDKWQSNQQSKQQSNNSQATGKPTVKATGTINNKKERNKEIYNTHTYACARGKYQNVLLTESEVAELVTQYGEQRFNDSVEELSAYMYDKPDFKSEHHIVPLTTWIQDRLNERERKKARVQARDAEKAAKAEKAKAAGFDFEFENIFERP